MVNMPDKMSANSTEWLPLAVAAQRFGYSHRESLRRRLRQLRELGHVSDIGSPPASYRRSDTAHGGKVVLMWPNPKTALLRSDAPSELLNPKRGRR